MQIPEESDAKLEINIVPMIDVIFSILAFFIISTLFLTRAEGLPVNLPEANTSQQQSQIELTVTLKENGKVALNQETLSLQKLVAEVEKAATKNEETTVIFKADKAVSHGEVVKVLDRLRGVEGVKLAIATERPSN